jgi:hypothetical protein
MRRQVWDEASGEYVVPPDIATDGACGLSWDDSIITGMTPAPSARCPFEYFHRVKGWAEGWPIYATLRVSDIPADFPVRPISGRRGGWGEQSR